MIHEVKRKEQLGAGVRGYNASAKYSQFTVNCAFCQTRIFI